MRSILLLLPLRSGLKVSCSQEGQVAQLVVTKAWQISESTLETSSMLKSCNRSVKRFWKIAAPTTRLVSELVKRGALTTPATHPLSLSQIIWIVLTNELMQARPTAGPSLVKPHFLDAASMVICSRVEDNLTLSSISMGTRDPITHATTLTLPHSSRSLLLRHSLITS